MRYPGIAMVNERTHWDHGIIMDHFFRRHWTLGRLNIEVIFVRDIWDSHKGICFIPYFIDIIYIYIVPKYVGCNDGNIGQSLRTFHGFIHGFSTNYWGIECGKSNSHPQYGTYSHVMTILHRESDD